jgi:hypothetical protein
MDRTKRWGNKVEQRQEWERNRKHPQHAHVPLRVLQCADCLQVLPGRYPAELGNRCGGCWAELALVVQVGG